MKECFFLKEWFSSMKPLTTWNANSVFPSKWRATTDGSPSEGNMLDYIFALEGFFSPLKFVMKLYICSLFFGRSPNLGQPATLLFIIILPQILPHSSRKRNSFTSMLLWVCICFSGCTTEEFFVSPAPLCSLLLFFWSCFTKFNPWI